MSNNETVLMKKVMLIFSVIILGVVLLMNKSKINIPTIKSTENVDFHNKIKLDNKIINADIIDERLYINTDNQLYSYNLDGEELWSRDIEENQKVVYGNNSMFITNKKDNIIKVGNKGETVWRHKEAFNDMYFSGQYITILKKDAEKRTLEIFDELGRSKSEVKKISGELISVDIDRHKRIILNTLNADEKGLNSKLVYHSIYGDKLLDLVLNDIIVHEIYVRKDKNILIGDSRILIIKDDKIEFSKELSGKIVDYDIDIEENALYLVTKGKDRAVVKLELDTGEILQKKVDDNYSSIIIKDTNIAIYSESDIQVINKKLDEDKYIDIGKEINKIISHNNQMYVVIDDHIITLKED
ncbi:hypothetical protein GOQ27_00835 [Clostridium sp. D2Q-11]|uniref:Uncharacterized protein n=1 Tax=Anaeromonas frigoriresistens TaxID=2683708 RepID=A0A942UPN4_9FIRM|nr:DUF5711 family protein [Anaeromonas frigoriresistens]MBS4536984.1 hypothetical protein [Anaeromonas frigoriresistens]